MRRSRAIILLVAVALGGAFPSAAGAKAPAVVRPSLDTDGPTASGGSAFFIRVRGGVGIAAVGTAHGLDLGEVIRAKQVHFLLGRSERRVATSRRYLVPPGRPFFSPGATLRDDFVIYALEAPPQGVRILSLSPRRDLTLGTRVQILGIPQSGTRDEEDVFGRISELSRTHIEAELDVPLDLRGWGGAPALDAGSGKVLGIVEASSPQGSVARISIAPISGVRTALERPLESGAGRPFASFAKAIEKRTAASPPPSRRAPRDLAATGRAPHTATRPLLEQSAPNTTRVHLEIEYPRDGAVIADSICGAFIAGRALAVQGEIRHFDVAIVIDTSLSTNDPTGADINGNGVVGKPRLGRIGSFFDVGNTDPGDSILAAEVAAARQILHGLDPRSTRVAVVRFAGDPPGTGRGIFGRPPPRPAVTLEPLTSDYSRVEMALDNVLRRDPAGNTHIAAGVDQATIELLGLRGALSEADPASEKIVFFFTDGQPTLPYGASFEADNVRAVLRAANRASRGGVRIHSFAIGPDALEGPIATVEMANRTSGYFTPVRHPGDLVNVVEEVNFANLSDVRVHNKTIGEDANPFRMTADGSWGGFIHLGEGENLVEVSARTDDGTEARRSLRLRFRAEAPDQAVPRDFMVRRNRLLEDCLVNLKRVRMEVEDKRNEQIRRELRIEIERERVKARERAAEQRKQLRIGIEEDDEDVVP